MIEKSGRGNGLARIRLGRRQTKKGILFVWEELMWVEIEMGVLWEYEEFLF